MSEDILYELRALHARIENLEKGQARIEQILAGLHKEESAKRQSYNSNRSSREYPKNKPSYGGRRKRRRQFVPKP